MLPPQAPPHILVLDGIRALAIISVICFHLNGDFGGHFVAGKVSSPLSALFGCGWIGVDLFFVLSGFLITGILCEAKGSSGFLRNFYARRSLRILPLYFGYLVGLMAVNYLTVGWFRIRSNGDTASLCAYYYNFWAALVTESHVRLAFHFWSLCVEEHFYLFWPFLVMIFSSRWLARICLIGALLSFFLRVAAVLSGGWIEIAYLITPCRLDGLLAGSFVAIAMRDEKSLVLIRRWAKPVALASGFLIAGIFLGQGHFVNFIDHRKISGQPIDSSLTLTVGIAALALFFSSTLLLIIESSPSNMVRRCLELRWFTAIGKYSYGMYVFHEAVHSGILNCAAQFAPSLLRLPAYFGKPLLALLMLTVSFLVAWLSYHLFEKHFLRLKRYFDYRSDRRVDSDQLRLPSAPGVVGIGAAQPNR